MNIQTDSRKTWKKIRTLKGINRNKKLNLVENDTLITDPQTVADKLARYFHDNSSDLNYDNEFLNKENTRKFRVFDTSQQYQNLDSYQILINSEISITELEIALSKCNSNLHGNGLSKHPNIIKNIVKKLNEKFHDLPTDVLGCLVRTRTFIRMNKLNNKLLNDRKTTKTKNNTKVQKYKNL